MQSWGADCRRRDHPQPITAGGNPRARAARQNAVVADAARQDKEATYPEFASSTRCRLVVLALETGGRFSEEAYAFVEELAACRANEAPPVLRRSAKLAWQRRWTRLLACAAARALAESILAPAEAVLPQVECGPVPSWHEVAGRDG